MACTSKREVLHENARAVELSCELLQIEKIVVLPALSVSALGHVPNGANLTIADPFHNHCVVASGKWLVVPGQVLSWHFIAVRYSAR